MRTFHIGGTASQIFKQPQIKSKFDGHLVTTNCASVQLEDGNNIVLNKNGSISMLIAEMAANSKRTTSSSAQSFPCQMATR